MSELQPNEVEKPDLPDAPDEPKIIMGLYWRLMVARGKKFSRGCYDVPNSHGVYVIYGRLSSSPVPQVLYVGRTDSSEKTYGVRGLRRRLRQHGTAYRSGRCRFKFLIVDDYRQRVLLEALATGLLCPADLARDEIVPFADDMT